MDGDSASLSVVDFCWLDLEGCVSLTRESPLLLLLVVLLLFVENALLFLKLPLLMFFLL